jgi:hypothetical protein
MSIFYDVNKVTGNLNTVTAGTTTPGNKVLVNSGVRRHVAGLGALMTVTAQTNGITITAKWQVSNDGTNWVDVTVPQNPANVALATGTAGTDAPVTRMFAAPEAVYGARFARAAVVNGAETGGATDLYAIGYCYRDPSFDNF